MPFKNEKGLSIVELLVGVVLTTIIMGAMYSVYRVQTHSAKVQEARMEAQQYGRAVLDMMVREIRNTGYFPVDVTLTDPINCSPTQGGIVDAEAQKFSFRLDADANGYCTGSNERVTYSFSANNITRAADGGAAEILTDGNITSFELKYFTQAGVELTQPISVTSLPNIKRVLVSLEVQSKQALPEFGGQLTAKMTSNADLRNRGLPQ